MVGEGAWARRTDPPSFDTCTASVGNEQMVKVSTPADALYGLKDLLVVAGELLGEEISQRSVRLYATQGLIDRPGKEGPSAVYGHRHLLQLVLVRALARRGLSLSVIAPLPLLPRPTRPCGVCPPRLTMPVIRPTALRPSH